MTSTASDDQLEALDRELLNAVQWDFPLEPRPFAVLGERLGIADEAVRARITRVKELGVLRQLSAIFDTRALGYGSALVAAQIDPDSRRRGGRGHQRPSRCEPQLQAQSPRTTSGTRSRCRRVSRWRTTSTCSIGSPGAIVTRKLPTLKLYKIGVKLDMTGNTAADAKAEVLEHEKPERREHMEAPELSDLEIATIRVVQEDLPLTERPFAAYAELIGCDEDTVLELLKSFKERKLMRRFAAVMNHRSAGFKANAMGVWAVPEAQLDEIGPQMAGFALVSHCYRRPTYDDWPYSIFTMVHGKNAKECEATIAAIHAETGIDEYALLWSVKEYKKTRVRYYTDDWDDWRARHLVPAS